MAKTIFCNNEITDIKYSGFTITKVYACDGELVYSASTEPVTPTNPIGRVYYGDSWIEINDDDNDGYVSSGEVNTWLTSAQKRNFITLQLYDNCTTVGDGAFSGCNLTSIGSWNNVEIVGGNAFSGCTSLTNVYFPCHIAIIGADSFYGCTNLTSVTICNSSNSVSILPEAFYGCTKLSSVTLGNSVVSIGLRAFYNCSSLTAITIPSSASSINSNAFYGCTSLTKIVFSGETPPTVTSNSFANTNNCPIVIPNNVSKTEWAKGSGWSTYVSRLKYAYQV